MEWAQLFSAVRTEAGIVGFILLAGCALLCIILVKLWGQYQATVEHLVKVCEKYEQMVQNTNEQMARGSETISKLTLLLEIMLDRKGRH